VLLSKYRLKCAVTIHVLMVLLMAFRLSIALYVIAGLRPPRSLQKLRLPAAKNWELVWLFGNVVTCLTGVIALLRNRPTLVRFYAAGWSTNNNSTTGSDNAPVFSARSVSARSCTSDSRAETYPCALSRGNASRGKDRRVIGPQTNTNPCLKKSLCLSSAVTYCTSNTVRL